jgi:hypothetical protein
MGVGHFANDSHGAVKAKRQTFCLGLCMVYPQQSTIFSGLVNQTQVLISKGSVASSSNSLENRKLKVINVEKENS